ncbi:bifunctional DNA primase/polymerase [Aquamicrobium soli]|uniref:Bifunctional DNA primase/polymerase n=1 Tax=Aquamicrobium soli TaxID=1811518 RepID=A0ABV7KBJ7_9HYPH
MTAAAAKTDPIIDLRVAMIQNGYRYVPVKGKGPKITDWPNFPQDLADVAQKARQHRDHPSTGILTGDVVAIDVDAPDPAVAEKLIARLMEIPGATSAPCRTGRAPKCLFIFRASEPRRKRSTAFYIVNGLDCQIEVLGLGQQFVAYGIHDTTGKPYSWTGGDPLTVPLADLPVIDVGAIDAYLADATAILAEAGLPKKEAVQRQPKQVGETFWQRVNTAALANTDAWVPVLFCGAHKEAGTGAWRVSSKELGRPLQEDISIHPDGIQDFGREQAETAINLVVEYGAAPTTKDAALWLCEQLGLDPAALGWEVRQPVSVKFGTTSTPPVADNDDEPPELVDTSLPSIIQTTAKLADFTHPGGLVEDMVDWIVSSAEQPSRELALGAVLAFIAALGGRRYSTTARDTRANSYIVALAESGFGKQHARDQLDRIRTHSDGYLDRYFGPARIMSASALRSALERWPSLICLVDEFGGLMKDILDKRAGEHKRGISVDLRDFFSASSTSFAGAEYAKMKAVRIENPNLNIYGTATPGQFWSALSSASSEDGLLPRLLLFNVVGESDMVEPQRHVDDVPRELVERLYPIAGIQSKVDSPRSLGRILDDADKEGGKKPLPATVVHWTADAEEARKAFKEKEVAAAREANDLVAPFIHRLTEHAIKLALIVAIASTKREGKTRTRPLIDLAKWRWASGLAVVCVGDMVRAVAEYVADNEREEIYKRISSLLGKAGSAGLPRSVVIDKLPKRFSRQLREEVIADMIESRRVKEVELPSAANTRGGRKKLRLVWQG